MTLSNLMAQIPAWSLILNCITSHMTVRKYFRLSALGSWERKSSLPFCSRTEREMLYKPVGKLRQHLTVSLAENQQVFLRGSHGKWRAMLLMVAPSQIEERIAKDLSQNTILPYIRIFPALCSQDLCHLWLTSVPSASPVWPLLPKHSPIHREKWPTPSPLSMTQLLLFS